MHVAWCLPYKTAMNLNNCARPAHAYVALVTYSLREGISPGWVIFSSPPGSGDEIALVLADQWMPGMSGVECLACVRVQFPNSTNT